MFLTAVISIAWDSVWLTLVLNKHLVREWMGIIGLLAFIGGVTLMNEYEYK